METTNPVPRIAGLGVSAELERIKLRQRAIVEALDAWWASGTALAIVIGRHSTGKTHTVEQWVKNKALARAVEVRPVDVHNGHAVEDIKQGHRDVIVIYEAQRLSGRLAATALFAGRVILVAGPPVGARGEWLLHLVDAVRADGRLGVVIEPSVEAPTVSPEVAKLVELLRVIDPAGTARAAEATAPAAGEATP